MEDPAQVQNGMPYPEEEAAMMAEGEDLYPGDGLGGGGGDDADALPAEDPVQMIMEMGQHPRMQRIQEALYKQLSAEYERLVSESREKAEELKRVQKDREDTGVALYGYQQQLARLHVQLENEYNKYNDLVREREDEEVAAAQQREVNADKAEMLAEHQKQLKKNQTELKALLETIRQVEKYNEEVESEIAVARRATYKAEEAVAGLEKEKKGQDLFIDELSQQLKGLREELAVLDERVAAAREETVAAGEILKETTGEMELINFEKKQLMQQWRSALIGLSRRDEALMAAKEALREAVTATGDYDIELEGVKREIRAVQFAHEAILARKEKLESERKFVEESLQKIHADRELLEERFALLQRSLATTEAEEKEVDDAKRDLTVQIESLDNSIQTVARERFKMENSIMEEKNLQITASKAVKNLNKKSVEVLDQRHGVEFDIANLENEMSRINIDKLNTEAHAVQLRGTLSKILDDLKAKDRLIEKYQLEIRQRNDEIEKKMYRVDRLNRKYEKMLEGVEDEESMGPLEATIKNLRRELEAVGTSSAQLQREWLRDQTQLVAYAAQTEELRDENAELSARITILSQKRLRLLADITRQDEETQRLDGRVRVMHQDMSRLNDLIGKNTKMQDDIKNTNFVMEREFVEELKELETESTALDARTREARDAKSEINQEVLEAERQLLLWEKKIELEKETKAALDPESGQAEVKGMEREIHRMRIRLTGLQREQEKLITDMERAIYKREAIATRFRGAQAAENLAAQKPIQRRVGGGVGGAKVSEYTKAGLQRKLAQLNRHVQKTAESTYKYEAAVAQKAEQNQGISHELEEGTSAYGALEEEANELQAKINGALYEKQRRSDMLERKQRLARRFHDLERGIIEPVAEEDSLGIERDLYSAENGLASVKGLVERMRGKFMHLDDVLGRVSQLCEEP
uniref:Coiled-coil domain-containing protein 40 n=1 Tax=Phaeomonas parva TaxID=124430 RepID=A0A7S1XYJ4_9STRA|mmetsp:Transcript_9156/g.26749  ORF Transcript_9156/g.26749 Transcript_9156/m.26749 type:complete len:932 (+) Transcript_9156:133-2928(+)|eukprot:CAMPEP_0118869862 /NCGR_PEP_ID=MMETSP1163-20130328/13047_1 /TAXON_ID=124430 /ORGANISM="Phaeomonas parva, Strain CCMP2877" /LENGTH=931 /DNA_ID=CAMNT_0006804797 /DNA_START=42 /DNA_END=2837 /DNA_ORIENTATION=-